MAEALNLPNFEMNCFAKWVANATIAYFENPEVQNRFEQWKKERSCRCGGETNVRKNYYRQ